MCLSGQTRVIPVTISISMSASASASASDEQRRPPRRQTKPMSLMHDDAEEPISDGDEEVQIVTKPPAAAAAGAPVPSFHPDRWILESPNMVKLADELVGHKSEAPRPTAAAAGAPVPSFHPDRWILESPDMVKLADELVG